MKFHKLQSRAKHFGQQLAGHAKRGLGVLDRGIGAAARVAQHVPEELVGQLAGPEAGAAVRAAKRGLGAYETVRRVATGEAR